MATVVKKQPQRRCRNCKNLYTKQYKFSETQWSNSKYCSRQCAGVVKRINDGLTRTQRQDQKKGRKKRGSPEWIELIRATTTEAMKRPEIKAKISKPKGPQSIQRRIKQSNLLAGKLPKNMAFGGSGSYPNVQRGDYETAKGTQYFRSKWEANYALYLDFLVQNKEIKDWSYEEDTFIFHQIQLGTRSYRPDFKVFNHDNSFEYHEVKGYMDSKSKTKLKRMIKYYPEIKIILIDREPYYDILKKLKGIINFY